MITRREILTSAAASCVFPLAPAVAQAKKFRILLNTSFSGPVSFFLLAEDRGYLRQEGLETALSTGGGAAVVVPQVRPRRIRGRIWRHQRPDRVDCTATRQ